MTLLCKCNWCGKISEYNSDYKSVKLNDTEYHYCENCVIDVSIALSVRKDGEQGKFKKIADCWTELYKALKLWEKGIKYYREYVTPDLELAQAIKKFQQKMDELQRDNNA